MSAQRRSTGRLVIRRKTNGERVSMHTLTLAVALFALLIQGGVAFAQQKQKEATIVSGMTIEIDLRARL